MRQFMRQIYASDGTGTLRKWKAIPPLFIRFVRVCENQVNATLVFSKYQSRLTRNPPVAMDESHLRSAVSYVSLNPVRARLVSRAEEWAWSSVRAHLAGEDDSLVSVRPVLDRWPTFRELLLEG